MIICPPEKQRVLKDVSKLAVDASLLEGEIVRSCHWVSRSDEAELRRRMLACGMAEVVPAELAQKDSRGKALAAGLFCVPHKESKDRLIIDRRAMNSIESRLSWAELLHGC